MGRAALACSAAGREALSLVCVATTTATAEAAAAAAAAATATTTSHTAIVKATTTTAPNTTTHGVERWGDMVLQAAMLTHTEKQFPWARPPCPGAQLKRRRLRFLVDSSTRFVWCRVVPDRPAQAHKGSCEEVEGGRV